MSATGFVHRKRDPFGSKLLFANGAEYSYDEFIELLPSPKPKQPTKPKSGSKPKSGGSGHELNSYALDHLDVWVPSLFPSAQKSNQRWRVTSKSLGRDLEEDISFTREGIVDFGVADMGDSKQGRRSPIDIVIEWNHTDFKGAGAWLRRILGLPNQPRESPSQEDPSPDPPPAIELIAPCSLDQCHKIFQKWLGKRYDLDAIDAVMCVAAVEKLSGDPVWLMVISGSGNAKTETVQATSKIGAHIVSTISSPAALLSASPRKQRVKGATGGLLREIGERGLLVIKDVTSILSQERNVRTEVLAALRELHDGRWARSVGVDGGRTLKWNGRLIVIGACTTAWDQAHAVVAEMGDRFIYIRPDSNSDNDRLESGTHALDNVGHETVMRQELAAAVAGVLQGVKATACDISKKDKKLILEISNLLTRTRTAIERDYRGNVIDAHDAEMPTRFAKQLIQIMRGGLAIGMKRKAALKLILRCAWDSVPKLRLQLLRDVAAHPDSTSSNIRRRLQKPRFTVEQTLQALHILGLMTCREQEVVRGTRTEWIRHYSLAQRVDRSLLLS
jgi:hypothetical protein